MTSGVRRCQLSCTLGATSSRLATSYDVYEEAGIYTGCPLKGQKPSDPIVASPGGIGPIATLPDSALGAEGAGVTEDRLAVTVEVLLGEPLAEPAIDPLP
jgi:hypothetical protein